MRRFTRKQVPYGPLWYLSGLDLVEAAPGTATFRLPVTSWLRSGAGVVTGGAVVFAADAALGGALHPTFPPNVFLATAELAMDFLEPPAADAQAIVARGSLLRAGSAQGLTEASIEDGAGRLLARATSRCIVRRLPDPPPDPQPEEAIDWPEHEGPHPFRRPTDGENLPQEVWDRMTGLDILRGWQRGERPTTPLSSFLGCSVKGRRRGSMHPGHARHTVARWVVGSMAAPSRSSPTTG